MKAIICRQPLHLDLVSRPVPSIAPGEVLVRITRVGLCGTDFHIYGGRHPYLEYPRVMGHELAGEVVEAPAGSPLGPGHLVAINPYLFCGRCTACRAGKPNTCANIRVLGVHTDGGMCEFLAVPESAVMDAAELNHDQAAMVEFLAIGAHAVARSRLSPGDRVLVVGAGPIGVAVGLFARLEGADVTLVDTREARLEYACDRLGFAEVVTACPDLSEVLSDRTNGEMFNVVFDATGAKDAMRQSLFYVGHGGALVFVGVTGGEVSFPGPEFHKRETTLLASRNALASDFRRVIASIAEGQLPTQVLHTHSFPAEEMVTRIPDLIADADHVLKAIAHF